MFRTVSLYASAAIPALLATQSGFAQPASLQAMFDKASKAFDARQWKSASDDFAEFRQAAGNKVSKAIAIAQIREGHARLELGEKQAAVPLLESGLASAPDDTSIRADRLLALQDLASENEANNEVELAAATYARAAAAADDPQARLAALTGVARNAMFADPDASIQAARETLALVKGQATEASRARAVAFDMMGRAYLIAGRKAEAMTALHRALAESGGMTTKIDTLDASIRADLGMAAMLAGDQAKAHLYLAAAGVARDPSGFVPLPKFNNALECTNFTTPEEFTIFEFGIDQSGTPVGVHPIYFTKGNQDLELMGKYIALYLHFNPADITKLHPVQAATVRLELHCVPTEINEIELNRAVEPLDGWLRSKSIQPVEPRAVYGQMALDRARADLSQKEQSFGKNSIQLIPALDVIAGSDLTNLGETAVARRRELDILRGAKAPLWVIASIARHYALIGVQDAPDAFRRFATLQSDPSFQRDAEARRYLDFSKASYADTVDKIVDIYTSVATAKDLPEGHTLRRAASAKLFYYQYDRDARREDLRRAGLTANPCRAAQVRRFGPASSNTYPKEAVLWGFEGWVSIENDLDRNGKVVAGRPFIAYPPLVFTAAANRAASSLRYQITDAIVPNAGCTATFSTIRFVLPK